MIDADHGGRSEDQQNGTVNGVMGPDLPVAKMGPDLPVAKQVSIHAS